MRMKRISSLALSTLAAVGLSWVATPPADAATQAAAGCVGHSFVIESAYSGARWSVFGDLYNGGGKRVHHWQETSKKGKGKTNWNFTYCGDGGWAHIWIDLPGLRYRYLGLNLESSYCWKIIKPVVLPGGIVQEIVDC